jgi:AraC-like DNA-binding protein
LLEKIIGERLEIVPKKKSHHRFVRVPKHHRFASLHKPKKYPKLNYSEIDSYYKRHEGKSPKSIGETIRFSFLHGYSIKTIAKTYHISNYQVRKFVKDVNKQERAVWLENRKIELKERASQRLEYYSDRRKAYSGELRRQNAGFQEAHDPNEYRGNYWFRTKGGSP